MREANSMPVPAEVWDVWERLLEGEFALGEIYRSQLSAQAYIAEARRLLPEEYRNMQTSLAGAIRDGTAAEVDRHNHFLAGFAYYVVSRILNNWLGAPRYEYN